MTIANRIFLTSSRFGSFLVAGPSRVYGGTEQEASLYGLSLSQWLPDSFVCLNMHLWEPITGSSNQLGFPFDIRWNNFNNGAYNSRLCNGFYGANYPAFFNTLMNKRNGPYGWPMFKQIRNSDHPLVRWQKENCTIPFLEPSVEKILSTGDSIRVVKAMRGDTHTYFIEPVASRKNTMLIHGLGDGLSDNLILVQNSFGNNLSTFANKGLAAKSSAAKCVINNPQMYSALQEAYSGKLPESPLLDQFQFMAYSEQIYPQDQFVYLDAVRSRSKYSMDYWKNARGHRSVYSLNSQGYEVDQSIWDLDGRDSFSVATVLTGGQGKEGELLNNYSTYFQTGTFDPNWMGNSNPYVVQFNTGSAYTLDLASRLFSLKSGIIASASWDGMVGTDDGNHFQKISISAWVNFTSSLLDVVDGGCGQPSRQTIIEFGDGTNASTRGFYLTTGSKLSTCRLAFSASYGNAAVDPGDSNEWCSLKTSDGGTELPWSTWHHVVATFDPLQAAPADRVKLYANGTQLSTYPPTPTDTQWNLKKIPSTAAGVSVAMIGSGAWLDVPNWTIDGTPFGSPFMGMMSDVAIYSGSLSTAQVQEIYNGGAMRSLYQFSSKDQLVSWWRLGGGSGLATGSFLQVSWLAAIWTGYSNPQQFETLGSASVAADAVDGACVTYTTQIPDSVRNRIYDMAGLNYATPQYHTVAASLVADHGLTGSADAIRSDFDSSFKIGAIYAHRTPEYTTSNAWPVTTVSSSQGIRSIRVTGSRIFTGDAEWLAGAQAGLNPTEKSYADFSSDVRIVGQEYGIVPEFRISEHMDYYLNENNSNFLADNDGIFTLTGSSLEDSSIDNFYSTYSHTDFLQYFDIFEDDHKDIATPSNLKLRCSALLKFLPHNGFYPAQRTLQLAALFSQSYGDFVNSKGWSSSHGSAWRAFLTPFFAPGILYNSIKAGMATDFPIYTDTYPQTLEDYKAGVGNWDYKAGGFEHYPWSAGALTTRGIYGFALSSSMSQWLADTVTSFAYQSSRPYPLSSGSYHINGVDIWPELSDASASWATCLASPFSKRIPFEGLVEPESYLAKNTIWDMEPDYSASLRTVLTDPSTNQAAFWGGQGKVDYKLAMHNFLAAVPEVFLNNGRPTMFVSKPLGPNGLTIGNDDANTFFGMDVVISNSQCNSLTDFRNRSNLDEFSVISDQFHNVTQEEMDQIKGVSTQMYSRDSAFGPPWVYPSASFTSSQTALSYHYSYEPFTPSYFNGYGLARILFYPYKGAGNYTLEEIQSHLTMSYVRMPTDRLNVAGNWLVNQYLDWSTMMTLDQNLLVPKDAIGVDDPGIAAQRLYSASLNFQQIDAAVDLLTNIKTKNVVYEKGVVRDFTPIQYTDDPTTANSVWAIQPKWETPILNFYNSVTSSAVDDRGSGSLPRGMWHQYGVECNNNEGIWMSIADLPATALLTKGYVPGTSLPHGNIFTGQTENVVNLRNTNAYVELFIRNYTELDGPILVVDGVQLFHGSGFTAAGSNLATAQSIADGINSWTGVQTWSSDDGYYSAPEGSSCLKYRFQAEAYMPENDYPYVDNLGPLTTDPVAAVRITVRDCATTSSWSLLATSNKQHSTDWNYPNYYASGKLGNELVCEIESDITTWVLRGAPPPENFRGLLGKNPNNGVYKSGEVGDVVHFTGGVTPKYTVKSLADLMGFPKIKKRLGEVAKETLLKEAVIAVPFVDIANQTQFFKVDRRAVDVALGRKKAAEGEVVGDSVSQMVATLKDYVLPPKFDFITNETVDPIAMYAFEFEYKLTKDDLKNIWQNLPPQLAQSFEQRSVSIEHPLLAKELLNANSLNKLRWMVFKVKQCAPKSYYDITADAQDDVRFRFDQFKDNGGIPPYSYNWPYDYCSVVELAKMNAEVTFVKGTAPVGTVSDNVPLLTPPVIAKTEKMKTKSAPLTPTVKSEQNKIDSNKISAVAKEASAKKIPSSVVNTVVAKTVNVASSKVKKI